MFDEPIVKFVSLFSIFAYMIIFGAVFSTVVAISESVQNKIYEKMAERMRGVGDGRKAVFETIGDLVILFTLLSSFYFGVVFFTLWRLAEFYDW